jgi:hypothetical protein
MLWVMNEKYDATETTLLIWWDMWTLHSLVVGRSGGDRMVVGFTTTYAISVYHH